MLDHFYKVNLRPLGGPLNGLEKEFQTNLTPGEILQVACCGAEPQPYVLLNGPAVTLAIVEGRSTPSLWGNAIHITLPAIKHHPLLLN